MLETQNKEYKVLASRDALTDLYNRHKFSELFVLSCVPKRQWHDINYD